MEASGHIGLQTYQRRTVREHLQRRLEGMNIDLRENTESTHYLTRTDRLTELGQAARCTARPRSKPRILK